MTERELEQLVIDYLAGTVDRGVQLLAREPVAYAAGAGARQRFKVDILVQEDAAPRVVVELKASGIHTHDLLAYGSKANMHRSLCGFLRYGLFVCGDASHGITAKWLWHGHAFDFMISCRGDTPSETELEKLAEVVGYELRISRGLENLISQARAPWPWAVWRKTEVLDSRPP